MKIKGYTVEKLDDHTFTLVEEYSKCLIYLLVGETSALLIDTGTGISDLGAAVKQLTDKPVSAVNTHGHLDHVANNHQFSDIYISGKDKEVFAAHTDRTYVTDLTKVMYSPVILWLLRKKLKNVLNPKVSGNYHEIGSGYTFDLGNRTLEVIETPGHTPGSICLLECDTKRLYSGDTVCDRGILLNLDFCLPPETFLHSIETLEARSDQFTTICPGHHKHPIGKEYLMRYHKCAEGIINGTLPIGEMRQKTLVSKTARYENILIAFKPKY